MTNMTFTAPAEEKYKKNIWGDPGDEYDPANKVTDAIWFRKKAEWLYSLWLNGNAYIPYSTTNEFARLRRYAQGNQPNYKYMDVLNPRDTNTGERKGFMNISWDTVPIYSAFRDRARGALNKFDYATSVQCVDNNSYMEREMKKFTDFAIEQDKEFYDTINALAGIQEPPPDQKAPIKPRTLQELDMLSNMGSYQLPIEAAFEALIRKSCQLSEWEEIKVKLEEDMIDIGYIAVQDYTDPVSCKPRMRYVDPQYLIVASNRDNAYTEIADAGEVRFFTYGELKDYGFDDKQIQEMAQAYQGMYGNPAFNTIWRNGAWVWDQLALFRVAVLDYDFESFDTYSFEYRKVGNQEVAFKLPYGQKPDKKKKNRYETNKYARRYRAKWVIGTSIVFDYGYQYNQIFDSQNRPKSSYSIYRVADRSMTSRCVSVIDDLHIAIYQFRNAWASAAPKGNVIDWSGLSNMTIGGGAKMTPMDVIKLYRQTGQLLWKSTDNSGRVTNGTPPIMPLEGGLGSILAEFIQTFEMHVNTLRQITAIGQGLDGNVASGDMLKGTLQIAEASMTDTLRPCLAAYKRVKSRVFDNTCLRWQLYLSQEDINEIDEGAAGQIVSLTYNDISKRRIQVVCEMLIDDTQKQLLLMAAQKSMDAAKTGGIGITYLDYFFILQSIERGQLKYASMWLAYREEQAKQEAQVLQQQNMQLNGQNMMAQEQAKQQTLAMEMQVKQAISQAETEGAIMKERVKGQEERKTVIVKGLVDSGVVPHPDLIDGLIISTLSDQPPTAPSPSSEPVQQGQPPLDHPLPSDQGLPPQAPEQQTVS